MRPIRTFTVLILLILVMTCFIAESQIIRTRQTGKDEITAFAATPDGKFIALGSKSKFEVLNAETWEIRTNPKPTAAVKAISFSNDGRILVLSYDINDKSRNLSYLDIVSGFSIAINHTHKDKIICLAISPDGQWLATGSKDNTIKIFDTQLFKETTTLKGHTDDVTSIKFSPDNKFLLSGSKDNTIILWDLNKNVDLLTFKGHSQKVNSVAFSPDSKLIASGSDDASILVWDIYNSQRPLYTLEGHNSAVTCIEFTPDGRFLGSGSTDRTFQIWDYKNKKRINLKLGVGVAHTDIINFISFDDKGKLYTCSSDNTIKYWNWGFPILSIRNLRLEDANNNHKIEGTEEVKIKFTIENSGDGEALKLKFNIAEVRKIDGLTYPTSYNVDEIPARTDYNVEIPVTASSKLRNSTAKFLFSNFKVICNSPFPLYDTTMTVETVATPLLQIDTIRFIDSDTNQMLTGKESGMFKIVVRNTGVGNAKNVRVMVFCDNPTSGLVFNDMIEFGDIGMLSSQVLKIPVKASKKTVDGLVSFKFDISDASNMSMVTTKFQLLTKKYETTLTEEIKETVEGKINEWQKKGKYEKTDNYKQRMTEMNRGRQIDIYTRQVLDSLVQKELQWSLASNEYDPDNESFKITLPRFEPIFLKVPYSDAPEFDSRFKQLTIDNLNYTVIKNKFAFLHIELTDTLANNKKYVYDSKELIAFNSTLLDFNFDPINLTLPANNGVMASEAQTNRISVGRSDVDTNIPEISVKNNLIYAVVIGNEDYSSRQNGLNTESNVDFAENDAIAFRNYLLNTYGVPDENIKLLKNATLAEMNREIRWLSNLAESRKGQAELIFYFSGHGLPDDDTKEGYIMPVDVTGTEVRSAIKLSSLNAALAKWPTKKVTIFLDACFSGGGRNQGLLAMKQVKIKPQDEFVSGNMVVFTSSSGDESSGFYKEKQHGMFTYFLLKKMQETKGEVDYQSLIDYLRQEVNVKSLIVNNKTQNPQIIVSNDFSQSLSTVKLGSTQTK